MKNGWKKFIIWAAVISTLLGTVIGSQVMAIKTSEALSQMKEAGKIQLVANVFSKCVKQKVEEDASIQYSGGNPSKNFFNSLGGWGEHVEIPTGAWLENQVQGKVNNGTIYCDDNSENLVNLFKSTLGISEKELVCDGDKPGLLVPYFSNGGIRGDKVAKCSDAIGQDGITFWLNTDGAMDHVKKLYNNKKKSNSYLVSWGDRGTFTDDLINYFLYFNDFTTACSKSSPYSGDPDLMNKNNYFEVKVPNPSTGKMEKKYYSNQDIVKNDWDSSWVSKKSGKHTCDGAVERINDTAPAVKKALDKTEKDKDEGGNDTTPDDIVGDITDDANNDGGGTQEEASPCSTASASLGWIICPVVQALSKAVDGIYGYIEDNYLQMNSSYVSNDSGTKSGWETFRNLANIVFVIVLVIIILSQITGFGVSNYGVKKMLPSLIIVAVLVNLSFFLCEIAVDISNIVGYGIKDTFEGIKVNMGSVGENGVGIGPLISSIIPTLLSGGALFAGVAIAATTWELWIMPFLLLLLVTVIGILFFFILLGMRQAGIIILIALAPVAIICYALPNTKSVFSRWWKLFSALLLVYPICGALMGGGHFASKLLLSNITASSGEGTTVFYTFVAILIQVVPFFFIPSILRSSFQAMGNLGNRLSMLGTRLGRSATGAIRRSDRYKDTQTRMAGNNAQRALRRSESERGLWGVRNRIGARMRSGNNRVSRAMDNSYNRRQARRVSAVAGRQMADQNARFIAANGLAAAERRQNDEMMKNYESNYKSDLAFMNNLDQQEQAYSDAINAVDADPTNQDSIAQLRALQNVLGSTPDGQDRIQRVLNHKLYDAQQAAPAGTAPTLSAGMQTASQTLMNDHGGFKSGNRGLNATLKDMNSGKVFNNGTFARTGTDLSGNAIYGNAHYGAQAAKGSASELANANDDTLKNLLGSVSSMNASQLASVYRNASEAITNDNISVKPENEDMLNKIRQAAYGRMQADAASSTSYHDNQGRTFTNTGGNNYEYQDATGATHSFTRDAATGNFTEVGGSGEVINSNDMMTASENFSSNYGSNYRDLHASDEFKVSHAPARRKIEMPPGWMRNAAGTWINSRDGFRNLTPDEVRRAEQYEAHNIQVDIDNDSRR